MWLSAAKKMSKDSIETALTIQVTHKTYSAFTETGATQTMHENQSDFRTETIDSNIFKSSQSNVLFLNPANQTSGRKQWNLNLFAVMLATTVSAIVKSLENFLFL